MKIKIGEADNFDVWQLSEKDDVNIHFFYEKEEDTGYLLTLYFSQNDNFILSQISTIRVGVSINGKEVVGESFVKTIKRDYV